MEDEKLRKKLKNLIEEADIPIWAIAFEDVFNRLKAIRIKYPNGFLNIQILVAINESEYYFNISNQ